MRKKRILFLAVVLLVAISSHSQSKKISDYNLENKVAIQGYDPVAYFKQNRAVKGKKEISAAHQGVVYYFATEADKSAFSKNPTAYEPQYGGWCAFAMGDSGDKVDVDPGTFKIVDDKLYLFYNQFFNNTLKSWNKNESVLKRKADLNWDKIVK